jgi:amino acid adenylation domain-containing protein
VTRHVWQYVVQAQQRFPDKVAFAEPGGSCTYTEFRVRCERLASWLVEALGEPVRPGREPVAVFLEKSIDALTAFFACAASGNFYAPLDVQTPPSRLAAVLDTLRPTFVITRTGLRDAIASLAPEARIVCVDAPVTTMSRPAALDPIGRRIIDTDLLYVIFTSGSTGVPKGVSVSHRAVIDYAEWASETFGLDDSVRQGNLGPFFFDLSVHDIFCTVRNGSFAYLIPESAITFPKRVVEILNREAIDSLFWVPSALAHVASSRILAAEPPRHLARVMFCGEVMSGKHLAVWQEALPHVCFVNLYGPTEATEACTYFIVDRVFGPDEPIPIGQPCENTDVLVLADDGRPIGEGDVGIVGELYLRGSALAFGYYNDPERTRQAFVQHPLHQHFPERVYRTGDLVKYDARGNLVFVGRNDSQIKRLGYRIELGEIEATALAQPGVERACAVFVPDTGELVLCVEAPDVVTTVLEKALHEALPRYMRPTRVVVVPALPLNANGKTDRPALVALVRGPALQGPLPPAG